MKKQIPVLVKDKIKALREEMRWQEGDIRGDFSMRHNGPEYFHYERMLIKRWIPALRKNRFILQSIEKQMPMPVKLYVQPFLLKADGKAVCFLSKKCCCQNCGGRVFKTLGGKKIKYCPHCGQKLWWRQGGR